MRVYLRYDFQGRRELRERRSRDSPQRRRASSASFAKAVVYLGAPRSGIYIRFRDVLRNERVPSRGKFLFSRA